MKWSVDIRDEPDAPGPRYRVALNIGDDYIPLEPQDTLDSAEDIAAKARGMVAVLIAAWCADMVVDERQACLDDLVRVGIAAAEAGHPTTAKYIGAACTLIRARGTK